MSVKDNKGRSQILVASKYAPFSSLPADTTPSGSYILAADDPATNQRYKVALQYLNQAHNHDADYADISHEHYKLIPEGGSGPSYGVKVAGTSGNLQNGTYSDGNQIYWMKNPPAPSSSAYSNRHIQLITNDGSYPGIGFHRSGYTASALYHKSTQPDECLQVISSDGIDWPITRHHGLGVVRWNSVLYMTDSVWTTVTFDTWYQSLDDNHACDWDGGTAIYARAPGWYLCSFGAYFIVPTNGTLYAIRYLISGGEDTDNAGWMQIRTYSTPAGNRQSPYFTKAIYLSDNQYVQVQVYGNGSSSQYLSNQLNWFHMIYLGW